MRTTKSHEKAPAARVISAFPPLLESVSNSKAHCKIGERSFRTCVLKQHLFRNFRRYCRRCLRSKDKEEAFSRAEKMTDSLLQNVGNGVAPNNGESAIVAAISSMSELLVSSITSMKSTMAESLGQMKDTIDQLVIEEGPSEEIDEQLQIAAKTVERSTEQSDKHQQSGSAESNNGAKKPTSGESTEQSINTLINQSSVSQQDACGKIELLSGIANDLKLDQKKAPALNEQIAKIVHGLLREKLKDEVLTATQNRYNTPENCDCLTSMKVNHVIWDKLKSDTRSVDIKLQRVQSNLVKGLVPVLSVIEELVQARDKIPKDVLDVPELIRAATDAIALVGAANFELNMRRRDNIKPELNEDYKHYFVLQLGSLHRIFVWQ